MRHHLAVIREFGIRYWIAWQLACLSMRVKDTTCWQVVRTPTGSAVLIEADAWGAGIVSARRCHTDRDGLNYGWPRIREFADHDEALDWMGH